MRLVLEGRCCIVDLDMRGLPDMRELLKRALCGREKAHGMLEDLGKSSYSN